LCRGGVFRIDVERAVGQLSERSSTMKPGTMMTAVVTLTVTSGVVWWIANGESLQVSPGTRVVQSSGIERPEEPKRTSASDLKPLETVPFQDEGAQDGGSVVVEVLSDGAGPVEGAEVILFDEQRAIASRQTEKNGRTRFRAGTDVADVLIVASGRPPFLTEISLKPGLRSVHLPAGAVVSGRLRMVDGLLPEGLVVRLRGKHASARTAELPLAVLEIVRRRDGGKKGHPARIDARGSFAFHGLPVSWMGYLDLPSGYRLAEVAGYQRSFELEHPREGLDLPVLQMPAIRGRVVTSDRSAAVPKARLRIEKTWKESGLSGQAMVADEKGHFEIPIERPGLSSIRLEIGDASGGAGSVVTLDRGFEEVTDLGDVPLAPVKSIPFVVRNVEGLPIAGAVAAADGDGFVDISAPTAGDGTGELKAPLGLQQMTVVAVGYYSSQVEVPDSVTTPLLVVLDKGTSLKVRLTSPTGEVPRGVNVYLNGKNSLFRDESGRMERAAAKAGATSYLLAMSGGRDGATYNYRPDKKGEVLLTGLRPGIPLTLSGRGQDGGTVVEETITLEPGEDREIELSVNEAPRTLMGVVQDEAGRRLVGAKVTLEIMGLGRTGQDVKADGTFRFEGIFSETVDITVKCPGYAPFIDAELPVPTEGRQTELVLKPGRTVRLHVADAKGRPRGGVRIFVSTAGRSRRFLSSGETGEKGTLELKDLPHGMVEFEAYVAYTRYPLVHDTSKPEARIELPAQGVVKAAWEFDLPDRKGWRVRLIPEDGEGSARRFYSRHSRRHATITGVRPGTYTAILEQRDSPEDDFKTLATGERPFQVLAEQTTSVRLVR
jgi:hypothetical protein